MNLRRYLTIDVHLYSIYVTYTFMNIQDGSNVSTIKISSYMLIFCIMQILYLLHYMTL